MERSIKVQILNPQVKFDKRVIEPMQAIFFSGSAELSLGSGKDKANVSSGPHGNGVEVQFSTQDSQFKPEGNTSMIDCFGYLPNGDVFRRLGKSLDLVKLRFMGAEGWDQFKQLMTGKTSDVDPNLNLLWTSSSVQGEMYGLPLPNGGFDSERFKGKVLIYAQKTQRKNIEDDYYRLGIATMDEKEGIIRVRLGDEIRYRSPSLLQRLDIVKSVCVDDFKVIAEKCKSGQKDMPLCIADVFTNFLGSSDPKKWLKTETRVWNNGWNDADSAIKEILMQAI